MQKSYLQDLVANNELCLLILKLYNFLLTDLTCASTRAGVVREAKDLG